MQTIMINKLNQYNQKGKKLNLVLVGEPPKEYNPMAVISLILQTKSKIIKTF